MITKNVGKEKENYATLLIINDKTLTINETVTRQS